MKHEQIFEVINHYRKTFEERGIEKINYPHNQLVASPELTLAHCHGMLDKIDGFLKDGHIEKVFRWLGFIQGVLWCQKYYTLDALKGHNRTPESPAPAKPEVSEAVKRVRREEGPPGDGSLGCGCGFCN